MDKKVQKMIKGLTLDYFDRANIPVALAASFAKSKENFSIIARKLCYNVNDDTFAGYKQAVHELNKSAN